MTAFMIISTGNSATDTVPLLATSDPAVISAAMDALLERIAPEDPARTPDEATR